MPCTITVSKKRNCQPATPTWSLFCDTSRAIKGKVNTGKKQLELELELERSLHSICRTWRIRMCVCVGRVKSQSTFCKTCTSLLAWRLWSHTVCVKVITWLLGGFPVKLKSVTALQIKFNKRANQVLLIEPIMPESNSILGKCSR